MTWDKRLALVVASLPLLAFFLATVSELRAGGRVSTVVVRMIPPLIGMNGFVMLWAVQSSDTINHAMTMVSLTVASSGAFIRYSRRSSSLLVACGGLLLAALWVLNYTTDAGHAIANPSHELKSPIAFVVGRLLRAA